MVPSDARGVRVRLEDQVVRLIDGHGHARLRGLGLTVDQPPTGASWDGERAQIPRLDLPFGVPRWQGTSGDRVVRSKRVPGADPPPEPAYKVWAPRWVDALDP